MQSQEFMQQALRTKSNQFHEELVSDDLVTSGMTAFLKLSRPIDMIKKALFYGKPLHPSDQVQPDENICSVPPEYQDYLHGILGLITETDELIGPFVAAMAGEGPPDKVNVMEECGDVLWYLAIILNSIDCSFEECMDRTIDKLRARFPDKFTEDAANNRDLDIERAKLEGKS